MNFDNARKNYSGLAFVAALHLVVAGFVATHSKISIIRANEPKPFDVKPLRPEEVKRETIEDFKIEFTKPTVVTPPPIVVENSQPEKTITTTTNEKPEHVEPHSLGRGTEHPVDAEPQRRAPVNVAAVIDAASCAKPAYPASALRNGDEGTVTLAFLVGKDGHVASAKIERTSGHRDLDRAALQGLSMCAFKPGTIDGVAQESWARMQYAWRLD